MPFVQIDVTRDGVSKEQKRELIRGVSLLLKQVLNKDVQLTHVIIREVETDNWGMAAEQVTEIRKKNT